MCLIALTFINMVSVANIFCSEIPIFVREQQNNMYRIEAYFVTKQLAELPVFLITPIVFNCIFYWMVGLNPDAEHFCVSTALTILVTEVSFYQQHCDNPNSIGKKILAKILVKILTKILAKILSKSYNKKFNKSVVDIGLLFKLEFRQDFHQDFRQDFFPIELGPRSLTPWTAAGS